MKISNLRIERKDGQSYLTVDVRANYTDKTSLWFAVSQEYEDYLTSDVYDAFLVAALYPAMYYDEPIEIEGKVSRRLYYNMTHYVQGIVRAYREEMHQIDIKVAGFATAEKKAHHVGTGFSAGVDSFYTICQHYEKETFPEYKIDTLFFFNVGSHGVGERAHKLFLDRYELLKSFPAEKGLPYIKMDSSLFDFYLPHWEYDAGGLCRVTAVLVFQSSIDKYYLSGDYSYEETMFYPFDKREIAISEVGECYLNPLLSTEGTEIITEGEQHTRIEKTAIVADYEPAHRYLNVCVSTADNCGWCFKCMRTIHALDMLGRLDSFGAVFDLKDYYSHKFRHLCYMRKDMAEDLFIKENVEYAKKIGKPYPSYLTAILYVTCVRITHIPVLIKNLFRKNNG